MLRRTLSRASTLTLLVGTRPNATVPGTNSPSTSAVHHNKHQVGIQIKYRLGSRFLRQLSINASKVPSQPRHHGFFESAERNGVLADTHRTRTRPFSAPHQTPGVLRRSCKALVDFIKGLIHQLSIQACNTPRKPQHHGFSGSGRKEMKRLRTRTAAVVTWRLVLETTR